jgi:hypothetical protein
MVMVCVDLWAISYYQAGGQSPACEFVVRFR